VPIHLWAFLGISAAVILAPGPDTAVVTRNAILHGRRVALGATLGINAGLLIWTLAAALGVAAAVRASAVAFDVLKVAGAVYLAYLGVQALAAAAAERLSSGQRPSRGGRMGAPIEPGPAAAAPAAAPAPAPASTLLGFRQGLFSNLANPKIAVFFTSLLPGFVSPGHPVLAPFLMLGGLFVLLNVAWLSNYAVLAARISDVLTRPRVRAALSGLTGVALVGLGIRLALERR